MTRISDDEFISRSTKIHGDKYDYSKMNFSGLDNWIDLICSEHGTFKIIAKSHLKGVGCIKCKKIKSARRAHNGKYDYSLVKLDGGIDAIICPEHGEFAIDFDKHIKGLRCIKCINKMPKSEDIAYEEPYLANPKLAKPLSTSLRSDIFNKVDKLASEWGVSKSYVIRFIVHDYFESGE